MIHYENQNTIYQSILNNFDNGGTFFDKIVDKVDVVISMLTINEIFRWNWPIFTPIGLEGEKIGLCSIYIFLIDENKSVCLSSNYFLEPLTEGRPKWSTIQYDTFTLPKGLHSFRVSVTKNAQTDGPNIDYITFNFSEISENQIDT